MTTLEILIKLKQEIITLAALENPAGVQAKSAYVKTKDVLDLIDSYIKSPK